MTLTSFPNRWRGDSRSQPRHAASRPETPDIYAGRGAALSLEQKHARNVALKAAFDDAVRQVFELGEELRDSIRDTVESAGKALVHLEQTTEAVRKVKQFYDAAFDEKADDKGGNSP